MKTETENPANGKHRLAWFPFYSEDFHTATEHLSDAQVGLYVRMMMLMHRLPNHELPKEPREICRLLRITGHNGSRVLEILHQFWEETAEGWTQKRLQMELQKGDRLHTQRMRNLQGGKKRKYQKTNKPKSPNRDPEPKDTAGGYNPHLSGDKGARARRAGLSDWELKRLEAGSAPSPMPSASRIREAIEIGQISEELASATMRGYF
jgi:uncharacterized protein YdaU (DUF1376 family)